MNEADVMRPLDCGNDWVWVRYGGGVHVQARPGLKVHWGLWIEYAEPGGDTIESFASAPCVKQDVVEVDAPIDCKRCLRRGAGR